MIGYFVGMKLKTQLILAFFTLCLITVLTGFIFVYGNVMHMLEKRNEETTTGQFKQVNHNIESISEELQNVSNMILIDKDLQDLLGKSSLTDIEILALKKNFIRTLEKFKGNYRYIQSIYAFTSDGNILGISDKMSFNISEYPGNIPFFKSATFSLAEANYPQAVWITGIKEVYFTYVGEIGTNPEVLLTLARRIRSVDDPGKNVTVIINMYETKLKSVYKYFSEYVNNHFIICDKNGIVISSNTENSLGKPYDLFNKINKNEAYGSIIVDDPKPGKQVLFCNLQEQGWVFVNEIPLEEYFKDLFTLRRIVIIILPVILLLVLLISELIVKGITRPVKQLADAMSGIESGELGISLDTRLKNELGMLIEGFNRMSKSIRDLVKKNKLIEERKRLYEIETLQSQMNPHFIYNTVNMIKWMAIIARADNIVEAINTFRNLIRPLFKNRSILCTIKDEIEYLDNYVKIVNIRFGGNIRVNFNVPSDLFECFILRFILQPLIENSITHGFKGEVYEGIVNLTIEDEEENLFITIVDNGCGISTQRLLELREELARTIDINNISTGIGLVNVNKRIKLHYGSIFGIEVDNLYGLDGTRGAEVKLKIPKIKCADAVSPEIVI